MKVNLYALLSDKIEEGLEWGIRRAYKHDESPKTEEQMIAQVDQIMIEIMGAVGTYLTFDDEHGD